MLKPKNIIIFVIAGVILVLIYIYFIQGSGEQDGLISTSGDTSLPITDTSGEDSLGTKEFLTVLLSVKSIRLDDSIFANPAFSTLRDSSIILTPDGTEGRPNPFAPIGSDVAVPPVNNTNNPPSSQTTPPAN